MRSLEYSAWSSEAKDRKKQTCRTDQPADRSTDGRTKRGLESLSRVTLDRKEIKKHEEHFFFFFVPSLICLMTGEGKLFVSALLVCFFSLEKLEIRLSKKINRLKEAKRNFTSCQETSVFFSQILDQLREDRIVRIDTKSYGRYKLYT